MFWVSTSSEDLEGFVKLVISCLNESKIPYVIVGGIASIHWGRPRTTLDVDIILDASEEDITQLRLILENNRFNYGTKDILEAFAEQSLATILHNHFVYKIDLKGVYHPRDRRSLNNRISMAIFGQDTYLAKPEDLVIAKLVYGSSSDFDDSKAILLRQNLNMAYLELIAEQEDVLEDLKQLISSVKKYRSTR